ncbi:MAG: hypothetical protein QOF77_426 [Solirubrobacteraceae bacterium]|nr:hypothetical protein [Solirubrobacteraceae bacterium]
MPSSRAPWGAPLAGFAAVVLAVDTWQPWYALRVPARLLDQLDALSKGFGSFGGYVRAGVDYARTAGPIPLSAHDVFHAIDVELVLIAVAVVGIIVAGLGRGRSIFADGDGGALALLGGAAFCLVGYRILVPPAPAAILELRPGIWVGLVASASICVGGLLSRERAEAVPAVAAAPPPGLSW